MKNNSYPETCPGQTAARSSVFARAWRFKKVVAVLTGLAAALAGPASAAPVNHGISAANVTVQQNDTANTAASVTLIPTLTINQFQVLNGSASGNSRADYFIQIGTNATDDVTNGILISSITDNGRNNGEGDGTNYGTSGVDSGPSSNPGASGQWWVPVFGSPTKTSATFPEYNFDFAAAYFPYGKGWYGGWLVNKGGTNNATTNTLSEHWIGNPNMILGTDVYSTNGARTIVDLRRFGLDSRSNAVMICCGGKNEENFADSQTNADGTWTVTTRDDVSGGAEPDPNAFVCIPLTNHTVISGRFMGDGKIALQSAPFSVTNTYVGTYHLVIPGATPGHGVLIISGEEGGTYNGDNIVSYQATADGWDIQTRDSGSTGTAAAPNLQNLPGTDAVVSFVYIPAPTPGFTVTPTNGLLTSESGAAASFSVVLDAPPTADVTVTVNSSLPAVGTVSTNLLDFNATNWNVPQVVTVTGVTNTIANGGLQPYTILLGTAVSTDGNYNGLQPPGVSVANVNSDVPGISVWPTSGLVTTESGGTATFYVLLNSPPASNVAIGLSSSNTGEGTVAPASLTFTANNWNTPQAVTLTGVDDTVLDGPVTYNIITAPAVSADLNYNGLDAADAGAVNLDNEIAGVNITPGTTLSVVEGASTNFSVSLAAQPVANVSITFTSGNPSVGTLSPPTLNFTPANWNVPQSVILSGVDNSVNSGSVTYPISASVTSVNPGYSTLVISNLTATTLVKTAVLLTSNQCVYGFGMPPVGLDGQALVLETAVTSFTGASLSAQVVSNADAGDVLAIRNDGINPGQIGVSGNVISYGGSAIGSFSGGASGAALSITLSNGVAIDAVQALVRAVAFGTVTNKSYAQRTVRVTLNDGQGAIVSAGKNIRVGLLRATQYQDGADYGYGAYAGECDIELSQLNANTAYPAGDNPANGLFVDTATAGVPVEDQALMRFDGLIGTNANQIPPGAIIVSAELHINVLNSGNGCRLNRMLIPWDGTNSVWNSFADGFGDNGIYADDMTARSEYDSQLGAYVVDPNTGVVSGGTTGTGNISIGVTPDVQAWANGDTNCGWAMLGLPQETDGFGFSPSEDATVANRPRLTVYWVPAGTASVSFRSGVNGYAGAFDTNLRQAAGDTNYATEITIWSDATDVGQADQTEGLLQFDNIVGSDTGLIPPNAHVDVAMLDLASVNSSAAMGNGGRFFAMLQPWQDTTTTWNAWGSNGIMTDGVQAAVNPTATAGTAALAVKVQAGYHSFEVTPDVQNWVSGTLPDYGWAVIPWPGGSDGWGMDSAEDSVTNNRPQLRVFYTISTSTPPRFKSLSMISGQVQLNLSGAPNTAYTVLRSSTVSGSWSPVGMTTTDSSGAATYTDTSPLPGAGFYRLSN
ncbi:MAG: DNRLRE domain-containing protein [Verrucomicrobiae bacterium]|nr:DNRLRE domain-containing protein [Verrucomicrobiae bacterium]